MDIRVGDIVKLKKAHPCGSFDWKITRVGMDFKMKCMGCDRMVMVPRRQAEKSIRSVTRPETPAGENDEST